MTHTYNTHGIIINHGTPNETHIHEQWRYLTEGETMVLGDIYDNGYPISYIDVKFIGETHNTTRDAPVIRLKSTDDRINKIVLTPATAIVLLDELNKEEQHGTEA